MTNAWHDLTRRLEAWDLGADDAETLGRYVVDELHKLARHHLRRLGAQPTLQPTAIVNEAYLRLSAGHRRRFPSRAHFFALASKVVRDILVDGLRRRQAAKRGGAQSLVTWTSALEVPGRRDVDPETILQTHDLLRRYERRDPRRGEVVALRFFGGLTMKEIAAATDRSLATVERDWQVARRWFVRALTAERSVDDSSRRAVGRSAR